MASKDSKMSNHYAAGKKNHRTLMIPQKCEIIRRLESNNRHSVVTISYNIGL
jgi:hypothetical protein